jgi:pimeloyl-ACP methyl ester carboxylesterase
MAFARANGIELAYEEEGSGEPMVLIMGIGAQLVFWPDDFVSGLAERGFRVVRFDNRDVGQSTKLSALRAPNLRRAMMRSLLGLPVEAPYTLSDMADDTAGLMDALGIDAAHVVGVSLGGMIAQTLAITHPHRVRSLTSIMSTPGGRRNMLSHPRALAALLGKPPRTAEEAEAHLVAISRVIGSRAFPLDETELRRKARLSFGRGGDPRGFARQFAAMLATGDRRGALRFLRRPAAVIHGSVDPLILPHAGRATARAIPEARLRIVEGMGHDLPRGAWPIFFEEISAVTGRPARGAKVVAPARISSGSRG